MLAIIEAAGWPIWPIILCSIIAVGIIGERFWSLRQEIVAPRGLLTQVVQEYRQKGVSPEMLDRLAQSSLMGRIFAAALRNVVGPVLVVNADVPCEIGRAHV